MGGLKGFRPVASFRLRLVFHAWSLRWVRSGELGTCAGGSKISEAPKASSIGFSRREETAAAQGFL